MNKLYTEKQLKHMSKDKVLEVANQVIGDVAPDEDKDVLIANILAMQDVTQDPPTEDPPETDDAEKPETDDAEKPETDDAEKPETDDVVTIGKRKFGANQRLKCIFPQTNRDESFIKTSHNGDAVTIPFDKEVSVKAKHLKVLSDAIETHFARNEKTGEITEKNVPRYNFQILE